MSRARQSMPVRLEPTSPDDDESQLLGSQGQPLDMELAILTDGAEPADVRRRTLTTAWRLVLVVDALGVLAFAGIVNATDTTQPITLASWLATTAALALVFAMFALMPLGKLAYHVHLHAWGFAYCMVIHAGLRVRKGSDAVHRLSDTFMNWPFLFFATPLCFILGATVTLREQPGIDLAALLPPGLAASLQALLSALGAAPPSGADPRQALAAHTHNFGSYFVPFVLGTLPNFLAKAGLLPDFSLSVHSLATWGAGQYAAVLVCAAMLAHLLGYHLWRARHAGMLRTLGLFYVPTLLALGATIALLRPTHAAHLHHYFTAALLVPLTRFPGRVPAVWQGLLVGFHLQGVAVFGIEPLFRAVPRLPLTV